MLLGDQPSHAPVVIYGANNTVKANAKWLNLNTILVILCVNVYIHHNIAQYVATLDQETTTLASFFVLQWKQTYTTLNDVCLFIWNNLPQIEAETNGRYSADDIFKCIFWMKMFEFRLKYHWSLFLRFQWTIFHHWFRYWLDAVQAPSHYLNQWWLVYWRIYASLGLNELRLANYLIVVFSSLIRFRFAVN